MSKRTNQIVELALRINKALPHDASPQERVVILGQALVSFVNTLPPSQRQRYARKLERDIPKMLERADKLARERKALSGDADYCAHHSTQH
jgi:hypothetical protein